MRFGKKALAFLTVVLMIFSNGFTTLPVLAAGQFEWPSQEFKLPSFDQYLDGKGYWGVKVDSAALTMNGDTPLWSENGKTQVKFGDLESTQLRYVSVKNGIGFFLYDASGKQVVPGSDTPLYDVSVSGAGGTPSVSVKLAEGQPEQGAGISHIALFLSGREIPTGQLTIKKSFEGQGGEPGREFSFTVTGPGKDGPARTVKVKESDRDGTSVTVPFGTYYIKETVPEGYRFVSFTASPSSGSAMEGADTIKVVVGEASVADKEAITYCDNPNVTVTCKNHRMALLDLGKAVAGGAAGDNTQFTFEITRPGFSKTVTLAGGQRQTIELEPGSYTIEEKGIDADYRFLGFTAGSPVAGKNAVTVSLEGKCWSLSVTCNNQKLGGLLIQKVDSLTGGPVAGVVFQINGPGYNGQLSTDGDGKISLSRLKPGDQYTVREISAPAGYNIKNPDAVAKEIPVGGTAMFDFADDPMGKIRIVKLDAGDPDKKLDGAVFQIANNAGFENAITLPATVGGEVTSSAVLAGHWWVREITAPDGYVLDGTAKEVDVALNAVAELQFRNVKNEGGILVKKLDRQTGNPVQGATFELLRRSPADPEFTGADIAMTKLTDADGVAVFAGLTPGTVYWVRETAAPAGYRVDASDVRQATVELGKTITLTFQNDEVGRIKITKVDKLTRQPLDGAVFQIADNVAFENAVTLPATKDGFTISGELVAGHWWVREITPPDGYILDPIPANNVQEVDVAMGQTACVVFANLKNVASLVVLKLDRQTEKPLPGAAFTLYKADPKGEGFDIVRDFAALSVSDSEGKAWFIGLTPGDYWLVETLAPVGFKMDPENNRKVTVGPAGELVTVTCYNDETGWLKIIKTDGNGTYLPGAQFQVSTNPNDFSQAFTLTTDGCGTITSGCLVAGTYWVKETKAPDGYTIDNPEPVKVQVRLLETAAVTFTDTLDQGALKIRKVSTLGGIPLAGVTFELMDKDPADPAFTAENILWSRQTDANGEILATGLAAGSTWWVRETATIEGYSIDTTLVKSATITQGQMAEVVFENAPVGFVRVTKIDAYTATKKLPGAVFGIYSDITCATLVQTMAATDANGNSLSAALPFGPGCPAAYYIREITAPDGYILNKEVFPIVFTAPGQMLPVIFADLPNLGSVVIKKVDALNPKKALAGASFKLYFDMGQFDPSAATPRVTNTSMLLEVASGTTGNDGILRFDNLIPGLYWLKETKAPKDYDLLEDYIPVIVIGGQSEPETIVISNQYNDPDPIQTGMEEWTILVVASLALLGGGALVFFTRRKKALKTR